MADHLFGLGFDVHPRDERRPLHLGGLRWDGEPGLAGHSDGDVVCHAVADALLGAASLGDLGEHFPEGDPATAGVAGGDLLRRAVGLAAEVGVAPAQCDVVVLADRPAIASRRDEVQVALARLLGIDPGFVSVKASRPEGLGLTGDGAGCLALVVAVRRG
ncbi:MAG TPA: 2-C-methyl-D-erythritol 2,4-cyclodiphosphate synthase [Actinomycetota bacterium]|nr:2-C-methyl-D-erythritol 2,4-cyclodiphosphate synthase [Actinomycetota bacterium]